MTREESRIVLRKLIDEEYGRAVTDYVGPLQPHQYDAACSTCYNLGPGAIKWRWGRALRDGDVAGAATILSNNYNTAGGRKLAGLVRRRKAEGRLLATGDYGTPGGTVDHGADADLLAKIGYDGPDFTANVKRFQKDNPPLKVDGAFGPASRATAKRALEARTAGRVAGAGGAVGTGSAPVASTQGGMEWLDIALILGGVAVLAFLGYVAYRNRGRIYNALPDAWRESLNTWWNGD